MSWSGRRRTTVISLPATVWAMENRRSPEPAASPSWLASRAMAAWLTRVPSSFRMAQATKPCPWKSRTSPGAMSAAVMGISSSFRSRVMREEVDVRGGLVGPLAPTPARSFVYSEQAVKTCALTGPTLRGQDASHPRGGDRAEEVTMPRKEMKDVIVLLPGITGSVLQKDGHDVWAPSAGAAMKALLTLGHDIKDLRLTEDPSDVDDLGDGVTAPRVMPDIHLIPGLWKIDGYGKVADTIRAEFTADTGQNFFEFPYDWRRDNRVAARRLARESHT